MMLALASLLFLPLLLPVASTYSPGACSGDCLVLDPSIIQRTSDGRYFRFGTGGGIQMSTADYIKGPWMKQPEVLSGGSTMRVPGANFDNIWVCRPNPLPSPIVLKLMLHAFSKQAPEVHSIGGQYVLYYCISDNGKTTSAIGVATSPTMDPGSWTDHGSVGIGTDSSSLYNAIDPNWIIIGSKPYLNFGSAFAGLQQVEMQGAFSKVPTAVPRQISYNSSGGHMQEGSYMFQYGNYYYLLFSAGINTYPNNAKISPGQEYRIVMCRSLSGTGDFVSIYTMFYYIYITSGD